MAYFIFAKNIDQNNLYRIAQNDTDKNGLIFNEKTDTIKKSYKDKEQQALKGVHENETLISHHPSCKSSWYTLRRDVAVH